MQSYDERRAKAQAARELEQAARCWRLSGVPERHREQCKNLKYQLDWLDAHDTVLAALDAGGMVGLIGSPGAGKTQIGVCAVRFFCQRHQRPCRYETLGDLFATVRTAYGPSATRTEVDVLGDYTKPAGLLVIDEIDKRGGTEAEARLLHRILDKRYRDCRPTLLIGNVPDADGLKALLDGAGEGIGPLFDRLRETGGIVKLFGVSFRGGAK